MNEEAASPALEAGHHLHFSGLFVNAITGLRQMVFPIVAAIFGTRGVNNPAITVGIIAAILLGSLFFRWLAWLRFRYFIGEDDIRIESGVFSRTARSIPYERIQDVSIEQQLLARLLNLAQVKFETGGGEADEARLRYVSLAEATRLRELVREHKEDAPAPSIEPSEIAPAVEPAPIFTMDNRRVFTYGLYSFSLVIFAVLAGTAQQLDFLLPFNTYDWTAWAGLAEKRGVTVDTITHIGTTARILGATAALGGIVFLGFASGVGRAFLKDQGFRLDRTAKGFRRRRGLFTLTDVVMPAHRVQAAIITTGPFRKKRGWHGLKFVSLAQESKKEEPDYAAAPFAQLHEIWPIVEAASIRQPPPIDAFARGSSKLWWLQVSAVALFALTLMTTISFILHGNFQPFYGLLVLGIIAFFSRMAARRYRYAVDEKQIYVRDGWWRETLHIAPQIKVQSIELSQGPISRRLGLATLHFGIPGGTLDMPSLPLKTARSISRQVADCIAAVDYSLSNRPEVKTLS